MNTLKLQFIILCILIILTGLLPILKSYGYLNFAIPSIAYQIATIVLGLIILYLAIKKII